MIKILQQPFPRETSFRKQQVNAVISGIIVVVFLLIFRPFGFAEAPVDNLNLFALGYGAVTSIIVFCFALFEFTFPKLFSEERWTVGKNILVYVVIIFLIGCANFIYTSVTTGMEMSMSTFLNFQLITLSVTIVVVSTMTMIRYFRSLNFYERDAVKANEEVHQLKPSDAQAIIQIKSENEKENFRILLNDLLYIESADNYSKVVYKNENKIKTMVIRSSLKRLEDQFTQPEIFRCHRTYIVQLRNVEKITGNSQGYLLHLKNIEMTIPVSRKFGKDVHFKISQLAN